MKKEYSTPLSKILLVLGKLPILGMSVQDFTKDDNGGDGYGYDDDSD
ncbi:MAG: hypothetical protein IJR01_01410 [Bacteroidales bacterium]|nr:hypothetical protein [Bacteroidales bacterium]